MTHCTAKPASFVRRSLLAKGCFPVSLCLCLAAAGFAPAASAQQAANAAADDGFSIAGSVRARAELLDGQFRAKGPDYEDIALFQTRVEAKYRSGPLTLVGEVMDSRAYGEADNSPVRVGEVNALEPVQYYLDYDLGGALGAGSKTRVRVGQMRMTLGSIRLVNSPRFRNTTNAYLGVRVDRKGSDGSALTAFWTMPTMILPRTPAKVYDNAVEIDRNSLDQQFAGLFYQRPVAGMTIEGYGYYLHEEDSPRYPTKNRNLYTTGTRLMKAPAPGRGDFEFEAMLQFGTAHRSAAPGDTTPRDVWAQAFHGEVGYTFDRPMSPRVALVADYASGQDDSDKITRFDQLYGAIFPDFAPPGLYGPMTRANVFAPGIDLSAKPGKGRVWLTYRLMQVPQPNDLFGRSGIRNGPSHNAGQQIFARARYPLMKNLRFEIGGALLFKGDFLKYAPTTQNRETTRYAYTDLTFTF
ncbi:alginate export family protein [Stakelama marina]|uniref:Alginate export family protein n=1 Tax=Stakelama marina TaxID=2826939 RepID=A0A8T4IJR5_9SPHN|nr:alginate export family protein [Stakelama marina]MBR0552589.1 alginate export family protein [Stakelama marina]